MKIKFDTEQARIFILLICGVLLCGSLFLFGCCVYSWQGRADYAGAVVFGAFAILGGYLLKRYYSPIQKIELGDENFELVDGSIRKVYSYSDIAVLERPHYRFDYTIRMKDGFQFKVERYLMLDEATLPESYRQMFEESSVAREFKVSKFIAKFIEQKTGIGITEIDW